MTSNNESNNNQTFIIDSNTQDTTNISGEQMQNLNSVVDNSINTVNNNQNTNTINEKVNQSNITNIFDKEYINKITNISSTTTSTSMISDQLKLLIREIIKEENENKSAEFGRYNSAQQLLRSSEPVDTSSDPFIQTKSLDTNNIIIQDTSASMNYVILKTNSPPSWRTVVG
jgi:hypothetical protein